MKPDDESLYAHINKICNFFTSVKGSGLLFCSSNNYPLILNVNKRVIAILDSSGFIIEECSISHENPSQFLESIKAKTEEIKGIIVPNLNEAILLSDGKIVSDINAMREDILDLDIPLLFWLSAENVSLFANKAPDFFLRRDSIVIYFPEVTGESSLSRCEAGFGAEYRKSEDFADLKLSIEILERQLAEAEKKQYKKERIAREIILDLAEQYIKASMYKEALTLYKKYEACIDLNNDKKAIIITADIFYLNSYFDESLKLRFYLEKINTEAGNKAELASTYNNIRLIYSNKGDWDKALEFYLKSEKIRLEVGEKAGLAYTYFNIGTGYTQRNNQEQGEPYIILAGFIAASLGKIHELSQMDWAIKPIIEKLGEAEFMKRGKKLAQKKGLL